MLNKPKIGETNEDKTKKKKDEENAGDAKKRKRRKKRKKKRKEKDMKQRAKKFLMNSPAPGSDALSAPREILFL